MPTQTIILYETNQEMNERKKVIVMGPMPPPAVFREMEKAFLDQHKVENSAREAEGLSKLPVPTTIHVDVTHYPNGPPPDHMEAYGAIATAPAPPRKSTRKQPVTSDDANSGKNDNDAVDSSCATQTYCPEKN